MNIISFVIFFLVALAILTLGNVFVIFSWARFINLTHSQIVQASIVFGAFTLAFIVSMFLSHYVINIFTRIIYVLSATWIGFFSTLFIMTIIAWAVYIVLPSSLTQYYGYIFVLILLIDLSLSIFGVFNARNLDFRQEEVKIANLPIEWQGKKVVQLSDVHLSEINNQVFLQKIVDRLNQEKAAAVFLTGDFFDGTDGDLSRIVEPLKNLQTEKGIYFIYGNHEMYMGMDKAKEVLEKYKVKILDDSKVQVDGLTIAGLRFPMRDGLRRDLVKEITKLEVTKPSIFLYHDPRQVEDIAQSGRVDLMLSGHTHNGQLWPYNYVVRLIYGIYSIGRHQVGEMVQFTSKGVGTWGPMMRTTGRPEVVIFTLK